MGVDGTQGGSVARRGHDDAQSRAVVPVGESTSMASFPDLAPLTYFGNEHAACLRAVGWLEGRMAFAEGAVPAEVVSRLKHLLKSAFQPVACLGSHECTLCRFDRPSGSRNLWVPGDGCLYVMPELALHYMAAHRYVPPLEFQAAVLKCPDMRSMEYRRAFLENGGRTLLQGPSDAPGGP